MKWIHDQREDDYIAIGQYADGSYVATVKERSGWTAHVEVRTQYQTIIADSTSPTLSSEQMAQMWCEAVLLAAERLGEVKS